MKKLSLFSALSTQFKDKKIICLTGLEKLEPKTKTFNQTFTKLTKNPKKLTLITGTDSKNLIRPTKNLPYLNLIQAKDITTYQILNSNKLIFTKDALKEMENHYLSRSRSNRDRGSSVQKTGKTHYAN